ncbi:hypothetical protein EDB89DRAFT_1143218 [Lactarius sanguifluus]|nr:hypothetical protein EDB89DRAFT_1143218 [Lactarius sanguifluus]
MERLVRARHCVLLFGYPSELSALLFMSTTARNRDRPAISVIPCSGINRMAHIFSSSSITGILIDEFTTQLHWMDVVFGDVVWDWDSGRVLWKVYFEMGTTTTSGDIPTGGWSCVLMSHGRRSQVTVLCFFIMIMIAQIHSFTVGLYRSRC